MTESATAGAYRSALENHLRFVDAIPLDYEDCSPSLGLAVTSKKAWLVEGVERSLLLPYVIVLDVRQGLATAAELRAALEDVLSKGVPSAADEVALYRAERLKAFEEQAQRVQELPQPLYRLTCAWCVDLSEAWDEAIMVVEGATAASVAALAVEERWQLGTSEGVAARVPICLDCAENCGE